MVQPIPDGYHTVTPYLLVKGVEQLLAFLKAAFDARETHRSSRPDGTIAHAEVVIGNSPVMMGETEPQPAGMYLYVPDCDALYQQAVRAGGTPVTEPTNMPWGDRYGAVKDPAGNTWWIATHVSDMCATNEPVPT